MRILAIQCPNCGNWQSKTVYGEVKGSTFKCFRCRKSKKLVSKGKLTVNAKFCGTGEEAAQVVSTNNGKKKRDHT